MAPDACVADTDDCTSNQVQSDNTPPPDQTPGSDLPDTGATYNPVLIGAALLAILLGAGLVVAGRRRGKAAKP